MPGASLHIRAHKIYSIKTHSFPDYRQRITKNRIGTKRSDLVGDKVLLFPFLLKLNRKTETTNENILSKDLKKVQK